MGNSRKDSDEFEFGVKTRLYNHTMQEAMDAKGLNICDLAQMTGKCQGHIYNIRNMRTYPSKDMQVKLCKILEISEETLFPNELKDFAGRRPKFPRSIEDMTITLSEAKQRNLLANRDVLTQGILCLEEGWEDEIIEKVDAQVVYKVLSTLTQREQQVIKLRFGLEDSPLRTLEEAGRDMGCSRERIRQIESKALRRLRHPSRARFL